MTEVDLNRYKLELSKISRDKTNNYVMCNSDYKALNFDAVCKKYCRNIGKPDLCSNDALIKQKKGEWLFVEFKNGSIKDLNIRNKISESLLIFNDIVKSQISDNRINVNYILVYNNKIYPESGKNTKSNSLTELQITLGKKASSEFIQFGLERYKGLYFREVHTMTEMQFMNYLNENVID